MHGMWNVNSTCILYTNTSFQIFQIDCNPERLAFIGKTRFIRNVLLKAIEETTGFNEKFQNRQEQIDKWVASDRITIQLSVSVLKFLSAVTSAEALPFNHSQSIFFICNTSFCLV